jgi:hypothetical protein
MNGVHHRLMSKTIADLIKRDDALTKRAVSLNENRGGSLDEYNAWVDDVCRLTNQMRALLESAQAVMDEQSADARLWSDDPATGPCQGALRRLHDALEDKAWRSPPPS